MRGAGDAGVAVTAAIGEAVLATSITLSARDASEGRSMDDAVARTICTFAGRRCRKSSRSNAPSMAWAREPRSWVMRRRSWLGLRSPSSSV